MKESIEEIATAVEALMQLSSTRERGNIMHWGEIEPLSGSRLTNRGKHIINKWRRRLEKERGIVTLCSQTIGVRLLTHSETAREIPAIRQRKAYRQIRRAIKQTATVDSARLSVHDRKLLSVQRANMATARRDLFRSRQQLEKGITATEVNPRRKVAAK